LNSLYEVLVDYRNYNTAFLIEGNTIEVLTKLNFGGAKANDNDFGLNSYASSLIDSEAFGHDFGSMLLIDPTSHLVTGQYLHFSTQCKDAENQPAGCQLGGGNPQPISSNDYVEINGSLEVNGSPANIVNERGFRTFGGNDVVLVGAAANVSVASDFDLGGGNDQLRVSGDVTVGTDFIAGTGDDQISAEFGSSFVVSNDFDLGDGRDKFISRGRTIILGNLYGGFGNDIVEIRGESPVGYGVINVEGKVELGEGNDVFLLKSPKDISVVKRQLSLGAGDDVLDIRLETTRLSVGVDSDPLGIDTDYNINFGEGSDKFINRGQVKSGWGIVFNGADFDDGSDDWGDLILNYENAKISTYAGINFSSSGRGTIDNYGIIEVASDQGRQILFGAGNDQIINRNGAVIDVNGVIRMGAGDDFISNDGVLKASHGIDLGDGDDRLRIGNELLSLDPGRVVDGGAGRDDLLFGTQRLANSISAGVDASQQPVSNRRLISASSLANRFVNFEHLIQLEGTYEYQGDFSQGFERTTLRDGVSIIRESSPAVFNDLILEKDATIVVGMINTVDSSQDKAPIVVLNPDPAGGFVYSGGQFVISADRQDDPIGTFFVIEGNVVNADVLAQNVFIDYDCDLENAECTQQQFSGLGPSNGIDAALHDVFLKEGSLQLVVSAKTPNELECDLDPDLPKCQSEDPAKPDPVKPDPVKPDPVEPDAPLPGCKENDRLCDLIKEKIGIEVSLEVLEAVRNGNVVLPLMNYGSLAQMVGSGLLPRNVDAPGRSLFNYNNLLVDTVFERLPLRQFRAVEVVEVVEEEAVIVEPQADEEPIRGLWSKTKGMDEQTAQQYLEQRVAQGDQVVVEEAEIELDGVGYVEDPSLTAQYAERDGVRAWYRAFGGDIGPTQTSTLYGDYNASAGGMVLGADVSLGSNVQIGAFANYGDVSLNQFDGDTGSGSWKPNGWGGGITADYWSENFYVQGLISASSFSGNQKRNIVRINDNLGDETASGEKSATSYAYALRLGAPFQAGSLLMEPQFTAAWTQNQESGFSENGADQLNLRYGSRTTNFLQTELGMKFALPIKSGERAEWVPNLRLAWLGDWDQNNGDQTIGYRFTDQDVDVPSYEKDNNGVLIEGGIDYTMANINSGSWKLYVRGGAEVWGGDRGTDWRASGGVTWQF
jgi:uncharacterized protein YhjY with autotransporter beta-barrel domain